MRLSTCPIPQIFPLALAAFSMLTGTARAQTIDTPSPSDRGWRTRIELQVDAEYDDNVFLLAPTRKPDLASPSAGDVTSGRFRGMESAGDVITDLGLGIAFRGPGLTGRTLAIVPSVGYEWYAQSPERSNLTLGLAMEQALPHQDMVRLRGGIVPSYFQKNYLSDAVDVSGDGVITNDERIYARGEYRETSAGIDYRHRLVKETSSRSTSLWLTVGGAYSSKRFDAPHQGRDLSGPTASIGLKMDRGKAFSVQVAYSQDWLDATADSQVMVLDEPDFGQDLNGNTTTTDLDVRVAGTVDRSRVERAGGARVDIAVGRRSELRLDYEHRWRSFSSTEPLDAANRGRRDRRDQFGATFVSELSRRVRMHVGAQRGAQRLDRLIGTAGAGDVDDYTRTQIQVGLTCTCLSTRGRR